MLDDSQLATFQGRLETLREALQAQYETGKTAADTVVLDQSKVGRLSRMDAMQQQSMAQSSQRQVENRLRRVNKALAKFLSGDYGYCDSCGNDIDVSRLDVQPEAPCCFDCQSRQEN